MIVDTHCHLQSQEFDADRDEVLDRASDAGVTAALMMGEDSADNARLADLAEEYGGGRLRLLACFGVHPDRAEGADLAAIELQIRARRDDLVAIGEVGLDYWVAKEDAARARQREVLTRLAKLAIELDLPLSVHSRSAGHHSLALLEQVGAKRVCMHAFDGAAKHAARGYHELGYFFSVPPSVLRSPQKQKMVARLPLAALLLESDSPVLAPEVGQRNEPANVVRGAHKIAEIKGCSVDEVVAVTGANARRLFSL